MLMLIDSDTVQHIFSQTSIKIPKNHVEVQSKLKRKMNRTNTVFTKTPSNGIKYEPIYRTKDVC